MPGRDATVTRRTVLAGLAVGSGVAAGLGISGLLGDKDEKPTSPLGEDRPHPHPYRPPLGAVKVLPRRREFYSEASDSEGQTFGDLYLPDSPNPAFPVVVLIHGGGWSQGLGLDYMVSLAHDLASFDVAVWNIEYRRVGSGGGWPTTVTDVCRAVDYLPQLSTIIGGRLDLSRVITAGHSAGGHLALWLAGRAALPANLPGNLVGSRAARGSDTPQLGQPVAVKGCVAMAGVSDLLRAEQTGDRYVEAFLGGSSKTHSSRYVDASPTSHLPTGVPVLCVHGADDKVVLPEQSESYVRRARSAGDPARLEIVPGRHDPFTDPNGEAWKLVRTALLAMAKPG